MTWELSLMLKATVLLVVGLTTVGLAGRLRASRRHLILASAFVALIVLPLAAALMPTVGIPIPARSAPSTATARVASNATSETLQTRLAASSDTQAASRWTALSGTTIVRGLWLLGAAGILASLVRSLWRLRRLRRSGRRWDAGRAVAQALAREAGLDRTVAVMLHDQIEVPMIIGVVRPVILLPQDAPRWAEAGLRRAFVHELEHIRRGDWWTHLAARAVCSLYWFHPLVWVAWRHLGIEAERACDDAVVNGLNRTDYADQLVTLAARLSTPPPPPLLSMANRSDLSIRVGAILNPGQRRGRAGAMAASTIIGVIAVLAGTIASLQAVAAPPLPMHDPPGSPRKAATSPPDANALTVRPAPASVSGQTSGGATGQPPTTTTTPPSRPGAAPASAQTAPDQAPTPQVSTSTSIVNRGSLLINGNGDSGGMTPHLDYVKDYVIGAGDVLTITFFRDEDVSGDVIVRPDGKISIPLINEIQAAGRSPEQLRLVLVEARKQFEQDPVVSVQVKQLNSRRVYIVGQVNKPGVYSLTEPLTVLQLIARAGGMTSFADRAAIIVARQVGGVNVAIPVDYDAILIGRALEQNIELEPGDTVVVK